MKLKIGNAKKRATPETYSIKIRTYAGDMDYFGAVTVNDFRAGTGDVQLLLGLVKSLQTAKTEYPHGRGGGQEYDYATPGFLDWFEDDIERPIPDQLTEFRERTNQYPDWPLDGYTFQHQTVHNWKLTYYDENSVAFKVDIVKDGDGTSE